MKKKLTILMFSLLIAVGWTSSAFAQSATYKAADMATWTYTWENAQGTTQTSHYVELNADGEYEAPAVTDAYQIYGLLRAIYMEKRLPGPYQSAYDKNGNREDDVYYGGAQNGWNIPGTIVSGGSTSTIGSLSITVENAYEGGGWSGYTYYPARIKSIKIVSGATTISSWDYATNGTTLPSGWSISSGSASTSSTNGTDYMYFTQTGGALTISSSLTAGYPNVEVVIIDGESGSV